MPLGLPGSGLPGRVLLSSQMSSDASKTPAVVGLCAWLVSMSQTTGIAARPLSCIGNGAPAFGEHFDQWQPRTMLGYDAGAWIWLPNSEPLARCPPTAPGTHGAGLPTVASVSSTSS